MNYSFRLEGLDCANCASKIERAVSKVEGVIKCSVSFMTLKMSLELACDLDERFLKQLKKTVKKIESDVKLVRL